jgi:RNA polymerase sigma factor (sigma-70 family)
VPPQRESPVSDFWIADKGAPTTPMQSLMEAAPNDPPRRSTMEAHPLADVIDDVLSEMDETDRDVVVMHVVGGMSIRDIAETCGLSKSDVHRKLPKLMEQLAELMRANPKIREYMGEDDDPTD